MHEQVFADADLVEKTDTDTTNPAIIPDDAADKIPVYAPLLQETPMAGTISAADPLVTPILLTPVVDPLEEKLAGDVLSDGSIHIGPPPKDAVPHQATTGTSTIAPVALLDREEADRLRERWDEIQGKFVDEPRTAVRKADDLVSDVIEKITEILASEHSALEDQWNQVSEISTEDLRRALQRYRSFFNRLVA